MYSISGAAYVSRDIRALTGDPINTTSGTRLRLKRETRLQKGTETSVDKYLVNECYCLGFIDSTMSDRKLR